MSNGLILTMGLSPDPLIFSIRDLKAKCVVFIGTDSSLKNSIDKTVEETGLRPSQYKKIEIPDDSTKVDLLCEKFQDAKYWLESQGVEKIIADPTGGRKWMSAGATMAASFLGIPMMYIDANYLNGKLDSDSMKPVKMGNTYDQTGFVLASKGRDAYNKSDFEGAFNQFSNIKPTYAHKIALYSGFSELCKSLAKWNRFEHYGVGISSAIRKSLTEIEGAIKSVNNAKSLKGFIEDIDIFNNYISTFEATNGLNLPFITDIYLNAQRCIQLGRYDDALGRQYRTLESISQYLLQREFDINSDNPNYSSLNEKQLQEFQKECRGETLPDKIDLKLGYWLLKVLDHPIKDIVFKGKQHYKNFVLEGVLSDRNSSILAHGFEPIGEKRVQNFDEKLNKILKEVFGSEFLEIQKKLVLPQMPPLGF